MKELQDIIQVKQVRLDALPQIFRTNVKRGEQKQHKLLNKALQIKNKIDGINIRKNFMVYWDVTKNLLPL